MSAIKFETRTSTSADAVCSRCQKPFADSYCEANTIDQIRALMGEAIICACGQSGAFIIVEEPHANQN